MAGLRSSPFLGRAVAVALAAALAAGHRPAPAEELPQVRIATEGARPPFNQVGPDGQPAGFEIDLGRALCEAARLTCTFVLHDWEGLVKGLLAKEYDAIMASLEITPKRKLRIAFSRPYYRIPISFIGRKDLHLNGIAPADLAGRTIGTAADSDYETFLEERYGEAEIKTYDKLEDANLDLLTERIDLVFGDKLTLFRFLTSREGACCKLAGDLPAAETALGEGVGIGLRQEDAKLKQIFDDALAKVMADGTYDRIRVNYVPFDIK